MTEKKINNLKFQVKDASKLIENIELHDKFDYIYANDVIHDSA